MVKKLRMLPVIMLTVLALTVFVAAYQAHMSSYRREAVRIVKEFLADPLAYRPAVSMSKSQFDVISDCVTRQVHARGQQALGPPVIVEVQCTNGSVIVIECVSLEGFLIVRPQS
jgi:hypothetical protein